MILKSKKWFFFLTLKQYKKMHIKKDFFIKLKYNTKIKKIKLSIQFAKKIGVIDKRYYKIYIVFEKLIMNIGRTNLIKYNIISSHFIHIVQNNGIEKYLKKQNNSTEKTLRYSSDASIVVYNDKIEDLKIKNIIYNYEYSNDNYILKMKIISILYNKVINYMKKKIKNV